MCIESTFNNIKNNPFGHLGRHSSFNIVALLCQIQKAAVWQEITSLINRLGVANRGIVDVRKKWIDIKCHVQKIVKDGKHRGGHQPWYLKTVLQILALKNTFTQQGLSHADRGNSCKKGHASPTASIILLSK